MTSQERRTPFVSFVGAGPGNPDLLTLRALRRLNEAEIVLHDALGTQEILKLLPASVRRVNVGKRAGRHAMPQEEINRLLVNLASRGRRVARLKGGDPVIFGRLEEEMTALSKAGIPCEIVPGITAASAAAASVGLSLTMRGVARRVQFVTGHTRQDEAFDPVASGIGDPEVTSVVYMARCAASAIVAGLTNAGWPGTTPVLVVASASQPDELHICTALNRLAHVVAALPADAPLVLILGNAIADSQLQYQPELLQAADATRAFVDEMSDGFGIAASSSPQPSAGERSASTPVQGQVMEPAATPQGAERQPWRFWLALAALAIFFLLGTGRQLRTARS